MVFNTSNLIGFVLFYRVHHGQITSNQVLLPVINRLRSKTVEQVNRLRVSSFCYMFDGVKCHFQQYFSYIVAVSFIGGGNRRTQRKEKIRTHNISGDGH